jgi:hypothetical protein
MTAYTWIGGTGNWNVAANWSPSGGPPTSADTAAISATGAAYTVTINSADVAQSLTESSASATVDDTGSLTLGSTFTLSAGTFVLGSRGTLSGGTTQLAGGTFACDGGTLSGVTYDGTLDLSETDASVYLASGTVVNNAAGTGAGTINDTGDGSVLSFDNTQTFNNATINLGYTASGSPSYLADFDANDTGTVLTLGSNVTIDVSGYGWIEDSGHAGDGIVNQGNISQQGTRRLLYIEGNSFTNSGTITAASTGGGLIIGPTTFTNSGTLAVSNGDELAIAATNFSNTGSITLASGSSLYLNFSFTLAALGTLTNSGGTVYIGGGGTFNNAGGTLNGTNVLGQAVLYGGTVEGGTATPAGLVFSGSGGTLSGVTYGGTLDLSGKDDSVSLADGTVVNNAAGTGAGTINDTGEESYLYFDNTQTFNNATISLGNASGYESYLIEDGTVLTLGSNVAIDESGAAYIGGAGIVNQGNISQTGSGSSLDIYCNFTNDGTITAASSGGALEIHNVAFTNSGTLAISNGDTVTIDATTSLSGTVNGSGLLETEGRTTAFDLTIGGTVEWENTRNVTQSGGTVTIGDSSGDEAELFNTNIYDIADDSGIDRGSAKASYISNTGLFEKTGGNGTSTIVPAVTNTGTIEVTSGRLDFEGPVTGTGEDEISRASTLEFGAKVAAGQTASFTGRGGELILNDPAAFSGSIGGFDEAGAGSNDTIRVASPWDFIGFTETAGGMEGTLGFANGSTTLSLTLLGDYNPADFVNTSGPKGSTLITYT